MSRRGTFSLLLRRLGQGFSASGGGFARGGPFADRVFVVQRPLGGFDDRIWERVDFAELARPLPADPGDGGDFGVADDLGPDGLAVARFDFFPVVHAKAAHGGLAERFRAVECVEAAREGVHAVLCRDGHGHASAHPVGVERGGRGEPAQFLNQVECLLFVYRGRGVEVHGNLPVLHVLHILRSMVWVTRLGVRIRRSLVESSASKVFHAVVQPPDVRWRLVDGYRLHGASPDAIHKVHMKLSQIMRKAYLDELIDRNPCDAVEGIKRPKVSQQKRRETRITKEQALAFVHKIRQEPQDGRIVAVWLGVATGLRRGEALALTWEDVDFKNARLRIRKQYGKEKILKDPKTAKSRRTISIDDQTVDYLRCWKSCQQAMFAEAGIKQQSNSPVCSNELCSFLDPDNFSRWRRKFFVKEGLAHYTDETTYIDKRGIERVKRSGYVGPNFHALRRAQATLLVAGGVDPKTVQARLGHESLNTTLNIYAEEVGENDRRAADFMGGILTD